MFIGCVFFVLIADVSAQAETIVYGEEGGDVALKPDPGSFTAPITNVEWKVDGDLAMSWDGHENESYRHFRERGELNKTTGVMTIRKLLRSDSGLYKSEINNKLGSSIRLTVISAVPEPTIYKTCNNETEICQLICDGDTTTAEPVKYLWRSDDQVVHDSSNKNYFFKKNNLTVKAFTCELSNPVSKKISKAFDPSSSLTPEEEKENRSPVKISTAVTVFISLLLAVILVALFHKWKTGIWFFEKESAPWEADFWGKDGRTLCSTSESNGTAGNQQSEESSEETPIK